MPGPPVVVCKGDKVIITVINKLEEATASLHFHGKLLALNWVDQNSAILYMETILLVNKIYSCIFVFKANISRMVISTLMVFHILLNVRFFREQSECGQFLIGNLLDMNLTHYFD